nr:lysine-specific demethylase 5B [Ipomoea batatas]
MFLRFQAICKSREVLYYFYVKICTRDPIFIYTRHGSLQHFYIEHYHCTHCSSFIFRGEPKCWYSVPGSEVHAFEKVMRNSLPDLFDAQPDLLFQLVTMLNPCVLQENGVPVYSVLQEPGNFIITFPRSYHSGFNFGNRLL